MISAITCVLALVFLCPKNVYAANPSTFNDYSASQSSNGVQIFLRAVQLKSSSLGTSMLPGGMESVFYVTCEIRNNNTQAAVVRPITFDITITEDKTISHLYTYSSDLMLERQTWFKLVPSSEFSYASNGSELIVVPPETSLYFIGEVCTTAQLDQTGQSIQDAGLRGINFVENDYYVAKGDYPYGTEVDFSSVIDSIEDLASIVSTSEEMQDIINLLTYTGTSYTPNNTSSSYVQNIDDTYPLDGVTMYVSRYIGPSYYLNDDIELDSGNDVIVHTGTRVIPVIYRIVYSNESSSYLRLRYTNSINEFFPSGSYSYEITTIQNDMMYGFLSNGLPTSATNRRCHYYMRDTVGNYGYIAPKTRDVTIIYMNVYVSDTGTVTWGNPTLRFTAAPTLVDDVYHPNTVYQLLLDWFNSYKNVNGVDDSSDISDDIADVSDSNHIIEETYYSSNASAIEATGLSNYRFSNEQNNGIGKVADDFMLLWNALGSWNGVYVFSLTMALATFIMRHGGLFTVKRKVSDKGGEGD